MEAGSIDGSKSVNVCALIERDSIQETEVSSLPSLFSTSLRHQPTTKPVTSIASNDLSLHPYYFLPNPSEKHYIMAMNANGLLSPPQTEKSMSSTATPSKIIITEKNARILCVADIRGDCKSILSINHSHHLITRGKEI